MKHTAIYILGLSVLLTFAAFDSDGAPSEPQALTLLERYDAIEKTEAGLGFYAEQMIQMQQLATRTNNPSFHSTITMVKPVPVDTALALLEQHQLRPVMYYAFALDVNDEIVTIAGRLRDGDLLRDVNQIAVGDEVKLLGIVSLVASVSAQVISRVQAEPEVFLVDISADRTLVNNPGNRDHMHHLAWDLFHMETNHE